MSSPPSSRATVRPLPPFLLLACLLPIAAGCDRDTGTKKVAGLPVVRVETPELTEVTDYVYYTGRTDSPETVEIRARVTGYLKSIDFEAGNEVHEGHRLFKIDPEIYQAKYDQAAAQVKLSEAQLQLAKDNLARAKEVAKTPGAIAEREVDQYAAAEEEASASLALAQANEQEAKEYLDFTNVYAPIEGQVSRQLLDIGNLVQQDTTLLTTVVSQDPMYVYFAVDEPTMLRVKRLIHEGVIKVDKKNLNYPVDIGLSDEEGSYPHRGLVDYVSPTFEATTGTLQIRGVFKNALSADNTRLLKPGMFVRVRVPLGGPHDALVISQQAINSDQDKKYLLVVNDKDVVEYRPIDLGSEQPGGRQVVVPVKLVRTAAGVRRAKGRETGFDSVTTADRVIVSGLQRVHPGTKVRAQPIQPAAGVSQPDSNTADTSGPTAG